MADSESLPAARLPYFDILLGRFGRGDKDLEDSFGRHVHWGYWSDPTSADGSIEDYQRAAEALTQLILTTAGVSDGMRVLDVGCGFGGTIASLDERFRRMDLTGLNLDERQLRRARRLVHASEGNRIRFVHGDACRLPFADGSFDVVLAVECLFHFPSRHSFFAEARRVLRPGGRLALSDFLVPDQDSLPARIERALARPLLSLLFGPLHEACEGDLDAMAHSCGLEPCERIDISRTTLPTYPVLQRLALARGPLGLPAALVVARTADAQRRGLFRYQVRSFRRQD
jgi:SAM-dependent methyltransferase